MATLDRQQWLIAASSALAGNGVEAVRVEPLAKRLGVTKGSFYWHFANRGELLDALLQHWESEATSRVIETVEASGADAHEKLRILTRRAFTPPGRTDRAIRAWATHDSSAAAVVERVDGRRLGYIERLLVQCALEPGTARARARMLYTSFVGESHVAVPVDDETRVAFALENLEALLR